MEKAVRFNSKLPKVGTTIFSVMSTLANEHQAINLSQGFPNFDCSPKLKDLVTHYMNAGYNQYPPMQGVMQLREVIGEKVKTLYGNDINAAEEVTVVAGATQGLFTAITAFISQGDEVIMIDPAYDSYRPSVLVCGGVPVHLSLQGPDYQVDWGALQQLITARTKMIIINTPHNPVAKTLKTSDMLKLQEITTGTDIIVMSDEVYEHLVFDQQKHSSILRFPELYQRSISVFSFGKTFHNTGWKVGYVVAPPYLMKEFRKVHQFNVFTVNTPVQHALADYLAEPDNYLLLPDFYQKKRDLFTEILDGSPFEPLKSEGSFFQLARYGHLSQEADTEFAKRLTIEHGVAVIPVSVFYQNGRDDKVVRFCFAKTEDLLHQAGERLMKASF